MAISWELSIHSMKKCKGHIGCCLWKKNLNAARCFNATFLCCKENRRILTFFLGVFVIFFLGVSRLCQANCVAYL